MRDSASRADGPGRDTRDTRGRAARWRVGGIAALAGVAGVVVAACSEVGTAPDVAASIEFAPVLNRTIAIGDSLRDTSGVAVPLRAIVRNVQGDELVDAPVRYLYVQFARDSALLVDSVTGYVEATKAPASGPVQIAARIGSVLQILREVRVTAPPDTVIAVPTTPLALTNPDDGTTAAQRNSAEVGVRVLAGSGSAATSVNDWLVRFTVIAPANVANDTTQPVFLLDDAYRPSVLDTTSSGTATRRVRVRVTANVDSVVVEASVRRRGMPVPGSPVRLVVPVTPPQP